MNAQMKGNSPRKESKGKPKRKPKPTKIAE